MTAFAVIVIDIKPDILPRLEDKIDDETFTEGRVEIVIDCFCPTQLYIVFHGVVSFPKNLDVGIRFAEDVQIL